MPDTLSSFEFDIEESSAWETGLTLECTETIAETFNAIQAKNASLLVNTLCEIPGPSSAVQMLGELWVEESCDEAAVLLRQGIDVLRPFVLKQSEDNYRDDVVGLVQLIGEQPYLDDPEARGADLLKWLDALLHKRPTDLGRVRIDVCNDAENPGALLAVVQILEDSQLRSAMGLAKPRASVARDRL